MLDLLHAHTARLSVQSADGRQHGNLLGAVDAPVQVRLDLVELGQVPVGKVGAGHVLALDGLEDVLVRDLAGHLVEDAPLGEAVGVEDLEVVVGRRLLPLELALGGALGDVAEDDQLLLVGLVLAEAELDVAARVAEDELVGAVRVEVVDGGRDAAAGLALGGRLLGLGG